FCNRIITTDNKTHDNGSERKLMISFGEHYPGHHAAVRPDAVALIDGTTGRSVSYSELDLDAWRIARYFRALGLECGDTVALCVENCVEYVELLWGAHYAGLVYAPINTTLKESEIEYVVRNSGASVLVLSTTLAPEIRVKLASAQGGVRIVEVDLTDGLPAEISDQPSALVPTVEGSVLFYSSGTTGKPKGIKPTVSEGALGTNPSPVVALLGYLLGFTPSSVYLSPAPLYHAAPLNYVLAVGQIGATVVVMRKFDAEGILEQIRRYRVTHTQMVPTMFTRLLALPVSSRKAADVTSLECVIQAAAPCRESVKRAMFDWFGPIIHEYYSGTEGLGVVYCSPEDWLSHPGTVGRSLLGPLRILDDDGNEQPTGSEGNIFFESPRRFEYIGNPDGVGSAYNDRGWGTFGDVGRLDKDGFLYIVDRRTDLIITGGVNVYPREVEDVLATHVAVADVAVIGQPDDDLGQRVTAIVQLVEPTVGGPDLVAELTEHCRSSLSNVKCPREIRFVKSLPRTETGKLLRRQLRESDHSSGGPT
ncbi:AMP-binding protein, partial [Mycobacterium sp. NPDC003449]